MSKLLHGYSYKLDALILRANMSKLTIENVLFLLQISSDFILFYIIFIVFSFIRIQFYIFLYPIKVFWIADDVVIERLLPFE